MTTHLVTFSDAQMLQSALLCELSAKVQGVDTTAIWNPHMLTQAGFYANAVEEQVKSARRGCNFWQWKPFVIEQEMRGLSDGGYLIYADAGIEFIDNMSHIIERMDQDIFLFGNNWEHAHWCKRDVIDAVWPLPTGYYCAQNAEEALWSRFRKQAQASVIFFRVSDYTRAFMADWLEWCLSSVRIGVEPSDRQGGAWVESRYLIDDSPSRLPNHPEFREHRHDQAILTTMAYREGIKLHWWPAVYNKGGSPEFVYEKLPEYAGDDYPVLFSHHRKRNHEWELCA